jgi:hypothetical protein
LGALLEGKMFFWLRDFISGGDLIIGVFYIPGVPFLNILWGFISSYLFVFLVGRNITWRGTSSNGEFHILGLYQFLLVGTELYTT